jgi:hypothetical protein
VKDTYNGENQPPGTGGIAPGFDWGLAPSAAEPGPQQMAPNPALDLPRERDFPENRIHTTTTAPTGPPKPDISTWR